MAKKKPAAKEPAKSAAKKAPAKKEAPKATKAVPPKVGALSAAATVLKANNASMTCRELIEAMTAKKLWTSPGGKTPANTLHAAIAKEINTKGKESRFKKSERGRFEAA